jgi:putative thiamine transport system permease protein
VARRLQLELRLAHTLGYSVQSAWWRVGWPQLLPRLTAPLLAVLAYGLTVVDVALVIGPTTPPTLAVLAWQWLQDADPAMNAQGAAAAWLLAGGLVLCAAAAWAASRAPLWRLRWTRGADAHTPQHHHGTVVLPNALTLLAGVYLAVLLALLVGSVTGHWPFPQWLPDTWTWAAWQSVLGSGSTVWTTVWLALASAAVALVWAVAWLEWAPPRWQLRSQPLLTLPLVLPAVLWVVGLHRLALDWQLDTTAWGLWLAHTLACLPYVLLALQGPYTGFDARLRQVAATLGHGPWTFLLQVKWPLLRAALAASFAIGFAVSVAQYLPTLYVGAGRFNTVTTEAVNLAAGGQRSLTAAFAWLQWLLPVLVFACAARLGRAQFQHPAHPATSR